MFLLPNNACGGALNSEDLFERVRALTAAL